jgi:FO synthase
MLRGLAAGSAHEGKATRPLHDLLAAVVSGERLGPKEARTLIDLPVAECGQLFAAAADLRDLRKGVTITYSPKVFVPITNLCRNRCAYCTFRKDPDDPGARTMGRDEIRECLRRGRSRGCTEALFCLGDKPERVNPGYRGELAALGHTSTVDYVREACGIALAEGLLPHTNMGVLTRKEMALLRPVNVSLGLMLESISDRLCSRGMPHYYSPDKYPVARLRMIEEAGELAIPFTTGILVGIGERRSERVDSLLAIRDMHERYGHIQEVIIQNFRAKSGTPMANAAEPDGLEMARTIAVARLILGPEANIQAPPNLSPGDHLLFLEAGINDWGGISPLTKDFVNPEAAWPDLDDLARTCSALGFTFEPRLCVYPEFMTPAWIDPTLIDRCVTLARWGRSGGVPSEPRPAENGNASTLR